ncbi:RHS repeat-associated protein [Roseimicrobium gellanilyticum]|uniref:RHS repeat-associated protein n=1 Tax=Roseimicrobium gellanilyticum TaxID=748857 RepID=A0A366HE83_9BACT|nr:RHS repeat-associated core domain-containing protein [Roseimicrobium gellanilyticum]RBP40370.1 RHS repeat-associated protein [Roseimicrobium gellanilyticum]
MFGIWLCGWLASSASLFGQEASGSSNPAVNSPPAHPPGNSKLDQNPGSDSPAAPQGSSANSNEDCCKKNEKLGSIDMEFPLSAFPFEPGMEGGKLWLYVTKPDSGASPVSMAAISRLRYHSLATMQVTSFQASPAEGIALRCDIEQASGLTITFEIPQGKTIGVPSGQQGDSEARIELLDAMGQVTGDPGAAVQIRQYRAAGGIIVYALPGGQPVQHTTRTGRVLALPDTGRVEIIQVNGVIRQVRTEAGLLDVVPTSPPSLINYSVSTYMPGQYGAKTGTPALYSVVGKKPSRKVTITALSANSLSAKTEEFSRNASNASTTLTTINQYDYATTTEDWTLTTKDGAGTPIVTQTRVFEDLPDHSGGKARKITRIYKDGSNNELYRSTMTQTQTSWGAWVNGDIQEKSSATAQIETIGRLEQYGTDPRQPSYKRLILQKTAEGNIFRYEYDDHGRMSRRELPWLDNVTGQVQVDIYGYEPLIPEDVVRPGDERPRTMTRSVGGLILSRSFLADYTDGANGDRYTQIEEQAAHAGALYGAVGNRRKVTTYYGPQDPALDVGRVLEVRNADGTMTRYEYELDTTQPHDPIFTTTVMGPLTGDGQPVPGKTQRTKTAVDGLGRDRSETLGVWLDTAFVDYRRISHAYHAEGQLFQSVETDLLSNRGRVLSTSYWAGPRKASHTDETGVTVTYGYDAFGSQTTVTRLAHAAQTSPLTAGVTYPAQPETVTSTLGMSGSATCSSSHSMPWHKNTTRTVSSGGLSLVKTTTRDMRQRVQSETDEAGYTTTYAYNAAGTETTTTLPSGAIVKTVKYRDGKMKEVSGNATVAMFCKYQVRLAGGITKTEYTAVNEGPRWVQTDTDMLGRVVRVAKPAFGGGTVVYTYVYDGGTDRVLRASSSTGEGTSGPVELSQYDSLGVLDYQAITIRPNANSIDVISSSDRVGQLLGSMVLEEVEGQMFLWHVSDQFVYPNSGLHAATWVRTATSRQLIAGFTGLEVSRTRYIDIRGNQLDQVATYDPNTGIAILEASSPGSSDLLKEVRHWDRTVEVRQPGANGSTFTRWDALGRMVGTKEPRHAGAESVIQYAPNSSLVQSATDPAGNTTSLTFVAQGTFGAPNIAAVTTSAGVKRRTYTARGQVATTWGESTLPITFEYDAYGQRTSMKTYRRAVEDGGWLGLASWPMTNLTPDTTTWVYDDATGLPTEKESADGKSTLYTYHKNGRLWKRTSARNVVTTYLYTAFEQLDTVSYSDGFTPALDYEYDRLGRVELVRQGAGASLREYDLEYNAATLELQGEKYPVYDSERWVEHLSDSLGRASHTRLKTASGTIEHQVSYTYDAAAARLETVSRTTPGLTARTFTYNYEPASPRLTNSVEGPAHVVTNAWEPLRDVLDIKENARHDSSLISRFDYTVNARGLRSSVARSGDAFSNGDSLSWTYDKLAQVASETHSVSTTLNRSYTYDSAGNRITGGSSTGPAEYETNAVNQYIEITPSSTLPTYDDDGNLLTDAGQISPNGVFRYVWDGENRLTEVRRSADNVLVASYEYDYVGRRIHKKTTAAAIQGVTDVWFVYDGWNLLGEFSATGGVTLLSSYVWGKDLSLNSKAAGGVGGLLMVNEVSSSQDYYPVMDGNGNVSEYLDGAGAIVAQYKYDAFGRVNESSGPMVNDFQCQFSCKVRDRETGLSYFGYRYYSSELGRWLNRDPIEEQGGFNLYGMVGNDPVNEVDVLGLAWYDPKKCDCQTFEVSLPQFKISSPPFLSKGIGWGITLTLEAGFKASFKGEICNYCCSGKKKKDVRTGTWSINFTGKIEVKGGYHIPEIPVGGGWKIGGFLGLKGTGIVSGSGGIEVGPNPCTNEKEWGAPIPLTLQFSAWGGAEATAKKKSWIGEWEYTLGELSLEGTWTSTTLSYMIKCNEQRCWMQDFKPVSSGYSMEWQSAGTFKACVGPLCYTKDL